MGLLPPLFLFVFIVYLLVSGYSFALLLHFSYYLLTFHFVVCFPPFLCPPLLLFHIPWEVQTTMVKCVTLTVKGLSSNLKRWLALWELRTLRADIASSKKLISIRLGHLILLRPCIPRYIQPLPTGRRQEFYFLISQYKCRICDPCFHSLGST